MKWNYYDSSKSTYIFDTHMTVTHTNGLHDEYFYSSLKLREFTQNNG